VKEQIKEKPNAVKLIEEHSFLKKHFESFCPKSDIIIFTTITFLSANYGYLTIQAGYRFSNSENSLIVTDAVCDREGYSGFMSV
jgi:hypothetical protein